MPDFKRLKPSVPAILTKNAAISITVLAVGLIGGIYGLHQTRAFFLPDQSIVSPVPSTETIIERFIDDPKKGLNWAGLRERLDGPCGSLLEAVDSQGIIHGCTHGPDPAPDGVDARQPVKPLQNSNGSASDTVPCASDGQSGFRVETMYVHASDKPNRYNQFAASFPQYAAATNAIFVNSGNQTGSPRNIRFVTDTNCDLVVHNVTVPAYGDDSFSSMITALKSLGYNRTDRKYIVWMDSTAFCGIGSTIADSRPGQENVNNSGPSYGRIDSGCWGTGTEAHELVHSLGGVQRNAPNNGTDSQHCNDEWDLMCYADAHQPTMRYVCPESEKLMLDCNKDDYFNTSSTLPDSNYLSKHWNTANNKFLIKPSSSSSSTPPSIRITAPAKNATISGSQVAVIANATSAKGIDRVEFQIDNGTPIVDTTAPYSIDWNTTTAANGLHTLFATAYDTPGNKKTVSITVTVQNSQPQPAIPGDLNGDGKVNISDLSILLSAWGTADPKADINKSGRVDIADLSILLSNWT